MSNSLPTLIIVVTQLLRNTARESGLSKSTPIIVVTQRKTCSSWRSIYFPVNSYHSCYPTMKLVLAIEYPSLSTLIIVVTQLEEYRTRNGSCQKVNSYHSCYLTAISLCMHSFLVLQKPIKGGANLIQVGFYTYTCFTFLLFH